MNMHLSLATALVAALGDGFKVAPAPFDHTKPFRTLDGRRARLVEGSLNDEIFDVEILEADGTKNRTCRWKQNGCSMRDETAARQPGDLINLVEQTNHVRRSLRPGMEAYQTRDGRPVTILAWDVDDPDAPIVISYPTSEIERLYGARSKTTVAQRHKNGRVFPDGQDTNLDVLEVTPVVTKWVKVYDKKLNDAGKQVVSGKEFAAERCLNWYVYDTELEARASMQGVRAIFPVQYREGEGVA